MKLSEVQIENFRCIQSLNWKLNDGLNILVGENDSGKTAVIDAIHLTLGSVAQEYTTRLSESDFRNGTEELRITCKFSKLGQDTKRFIEYLTYEEANGSEPVLYLSLCSEKTGNHRFPIRSQYLCGKPIEVVNPNDNQVHFQPNGGSIDLEARQFFRATYLKPLRDAATELKARRGSRLSLLMYHLLVQEDSKQTSLEQAIADFETNLTDNFTGYTARKDGDNNHGVILEQLLGMLFQDEQSMTQIKLGLSTEQKLRGLLERLDLGYSENDSFYERGLGYSNLLFIAAELSLLDAGFRFLMVEEPEAHLHPQLQIKLVEHFETLNNTQIVLTTHSPNLASKARIETVTILKAGKAYPLDSGSTKLDGDDRQFLQRFLDVTRANLFFARGVLLVEGESEELLIPTIAKLLGKDLTKHGVSIVKVGSKAAARYANVFVRTDGKQLDIPVAIVTDKDRIPAAMQEIHPEYKKKDAGEIAEINEQYVRTCVSENWTLEYDLALGDGEGNDLAIELLQAMFRLDDQSENSNVTTSHPAYVTNGKDLHTSMMTHFDKDRQKVACQIMYIFELNTIKKDESESRDFSALRKKGKPEMAQALAIILEEYTPVNLKSRLPSYLVEAIEHVTT